MRNLRTQLGWLVVLVATGSASAQEATGLAAAAASPVQSG